MNKVFRTQKFLIISLIVVVGLLLIGGIYRAAHKRTDTTATPPAAQPTITYAPATTEEKAESVQAKEDLANGTRDNQAAAPAPGSKKSVTPVITAAYLAGDSVQVNGYVGGVFEDGGTCTATFTQGSKSAVTTSSAFANATTTDCQTLTISRTKLDGTGNWQIILTYTSPTANGASAAKTLAL